MAIDFALTPSSEESREYYQRLARERMRPISRRYDEHEHARPDEWIDHYWNVVRHEAPRGGKGDASDGFVRTCIQAEELCWGDAGLYLRMPVGALGGSAGWTLDPVPLVGR